MMMMMMTFRESRRRHQSRDHFSPRIGYFLLVVPWNQASISNGFRDIQR